MLKNKFKASIVHLTLSIIVVSLLMLAVIYFWFPFSFLHLTDFKEIVILIIAIDLVLGPVLTFVVFKPKKKSLVFDLSTIAVIQVFALSYGMYMLYQVHPVYITFAKDSFTLVAAKDAQPQKSKYDEYKISKLKSAKFAYAKMPEGGHKQTELLFNALAGGADLEERVDYYEPYNNHVDDIVAKSLDPDTIFSDKTAEEETLKFLKEYGDDLDKFAYLPLDGASKDAIIVIDKKTAKPVTNINIDPWKYVKK